MDFGDTLEGDLGSRDFSVNAMAVALPGREFVDPYGGVVDLAHRMLRTPGRPEDSFSDDPLRMLRAARFAAQLGFDVDPAVVAAMAAIGSVRFSQVGVSLRRSRRRRITRPRRP